MSELTVSADGIVTGNTYDKYGSHNPVVRRMMAGFQRCLDELVERAAPDSLLDVGCGEGLLVQRVAERLPAARVVGVDLQEQSIQAGWSRHEAPNLSYRTMDGRTLPFADGEFDTVMSCLGVMFAPYHQASADELIRVCRPGGTIGLLNWTPEGFIGQMFATMKPYAPPPPPGAQPPPLWGREEHVRTLLGDQVTDVKARRQTVRIDIFGRPEDFRDYFKANYGPTIAVYRAIADDPERVAALDAELADLARRHDLGSGSTVMEWEYLLLTARKRS